MICFEEMIGGQSIARLPCLCVYHKRFVFPLFPFSSRSNFFTVGNFFPINMHTIIMVSILLSVVSTPGLKSKIRVPSIPVMNESSYSQLVTVITCCVCHNCILWNPFNSVGPLRKLR